MLSGWRIHRDFYDVCGPVCTHGKLCHLELENKAIAFSESRRLVLRWELFNAFNTPQFGNPASNASAAASFGKILSAGAGRTMQLALKFEF
ncbi:MAG: hypothetical protein L0387_35800 [Acidobacteria bacterium]|nr:hypothetical protein [Acidobacteriota bacterium]MCI0724599.1 hypothetical protein [Acidobacteriota bacterium]